MFRDPERMQEDSETLDLAQKEALRRARVAALIAARAKRPDPVQQELERRERNRPFVDQFLRKYYGH